MRFLGARSNTRIGTAPNRVRPHAAHPCVVALITRGTLASAALLSGVAPQPAAQRAGASWARGVEGQRKADLGDGTYLNPILAGDHPDPSILKDGADYYMTFSSFDAYPGLVIWHSTDLVNWRPLGPALFTNVGAVWAPDLVKHRGRYYIYFPGVGKYRSNYVIWADDIRGPWSEPIDLKIGQIDPGHHGVLPHHLALAGHGQPVFIVQA